MCDVFGRRKWPDQQRFYFQVVLAEMITKDELLDRLLRLVPTSAEEALAAGRLLGFLPMSTCGELTLSAEKSRG